MEQVYRLTRQVARSNASVLLLGETGTGKELIAKAIHRLSPRGSGPFVRVNCGALAENLLESELFGHVRGAFTGAVDNRTGRFEAAHTGTVFLDEINSTTPKLQVKLLRVLQEHEFERVGDTQTIRVDTRVIAASNRDLLEETEAGRFREDLYYRLNVVTIYLPPLRERREDIPALVGYFLKLYNEENFRHAPHVEPAAMQALQDYSWPGNVRELQNYIERAVVLAPGDELTADLLPEAVRGRQAPPHRPHAADPETLASELVRQGIDAGRPQRREPPRRDRQPRGAGVDRPGDGRLRRRADQGRRAAGHQPQHAAQEAQGIRAGKVTRSTMLFRRKHHLFCRQLRRGAGAGNLAAAVPQRRARGWSCWASPRPDWWPIRRFSTTAPSARRGRRAAVEPAGLVPRGGLGAGGGLSVPGHLAPQGALRPVPAAAGAGADRRGHVSGRRGSRWPASRPRKSGGRSTASRSCWPPSPCWWGSWPG